MKSLVSKKIGIWFLAFSLFFAHFVLRNVAHADTGSAWKQMYAKGGECSISFPSPPQMITQTLNLPEGGKLFYDIYLAPFENKGVFLLLVATYPGALTTGHELAAVEGLMQGIVAHHPGNTLEFAEEIQVDGHLGMTFLVKSDSSYFRGQAIMVGNKLYLIAMEGKKSSLEENTFSRFVKTFQISRSALNSR